MLNEDQHDIFHSFYVSKEWRKLRQHILNEYPLCFYCKIRVSEHVHHIYPLHRYWQYRLSAYIDDDVNLVGVCLLCHNKETRKEQNALKEMVRDARQSELEEFD